MSKIVIAFVLVIFFFVFLLLFWIIVFTIALLIFSSKDKQWKPFPKGKKTRVV